MSTCKDCLCFGMCLLSSEKAGICKYFKDRSKFIEMPCKVGDLVYYITLDKTIRSMLIAQIFIDRAEKTIGDGGGIYFLFEDFGKSVFLTKEKAEQVFAERGETGGN